MTKLDMELKQAAWSAERIHLKVKLGERKAEVTNLENSQLSILRKHENIKGAANHTVG